MYALAYRLSVYVCILCVSVIDLLLHLCRDFPSHVEPDWDAEDDVINDMVLLGIVGIQDPVRHEVR